MGVYLTTNSPISGTYAPTAFSTNILFPAPAPGGPYGTNFSNLIGANPAGTWSLYVFDDKVVDAGSINNGWVLGISSLNLAAPSVDLIAGMTASANPTVAGSNLTYTITVTNSGPAPATGVFLTNYLPGRGDGCFEQLVARKRLVRWGQQHHGMQSWRAGD